jgi:hypothetical protein
LGKPSYCGCSFRHGFRASIRVLRELPVSLRPWASTPVPPLSMFCTCHYLIFPFVTHGSRDLRH